MIKIAIVDDREKALTALKTYMNLLCEKEEGKYGFETYSDGLDFIEKFDGSYDLVFLDAEMPNISGIEVARRIRATGCECEIILIADNDDSALAGYEVDASDYLIKPINFLTFVNALKKSEARILERKKTAVSIILQNRNGVKILSSSNVYYVEVAGHDLKISATEGEFTIRRSLKELENKLSRVDFVRCNSCYLVNMQYIDYIKDNAVSVNGRELLISRHKKKELIDAYLEYAKKLK